jgi:capsular polysaccharide biosynthesis protein
MITGGVNAPTGAGQKTININVNATEKDLAQRIANEIRSHLYREQLTGMA